MKSLGLLAMLASDYNKVGHRIKFPCYSDYKLDGIRCLAFKNNGVISLKSRTGQDYSVPHLEQALNTVMKDGDVLDGEVYFHGESLQDITSAVKRIDTQSEIDACKKKLIKHDVDPNGSDQAWHVKWEQLDKELKDAEHIHKLRQKLQFHIFDIPSDKKFDDRLDDMDEFWMMNKDKEAFGEFLFMTQYTLVHSDEQLRNIEHPRAVNDGFEGVMIRSKDGMYESGKRSADLQKYKCFLDSEFEILDIVPDKQGDGVFARMT